MDLFALVVVIILIALSLLAIGYIIFVIFYHPFQVLKVAPIALMDPCPVGQCVRETPTSPCERTIEGQYTCNLTHSDAIVKYDSNSHLLQMRNTACPNRLIDANFCLEVGEQQQEGEKRECLKCPSHENGQYYLQCPLKGQDTYVHSTKKLYYTPTNYIEPQKGICPLK